ncbi:MAG: hypothetical protein FWE33_05630 [Defluviitaleaceae bacterium]|nr:hypothetical protein [Defluviitaleaceae bacterium]
MNAILGMTKLNFKHSKIAYLITGAALLSNVISLVLLGFGIDSGVNDIATYLFALPIFMAIFIPALNFYPFMNLGGKRIDFFQANIITYLITIFIVTAISFLVHSTIDQFVFNHNDYDISLWTTFGFTQNNNFIAMLQMFSFFTLLISAIHAIVLMQGRWYGWVINAIIVAIISVFTPIAPLRAALAWFFNLIIFHDTAILQIINCLILAAIIYTASLIPLKHKPV